MYVISDLTRALNYQIVTLGMELPILNLAQEKIQEMLRVGEDI